MAVKVPENRPGNLEKGEKKVPGISRAIFKVTEGLTFGKKAVWLANFVAKSLKFVLELYFCSLYWKKFLLKSSYRKNVLERRLVLDKPYLGARVAPKSTPRRSQKGS